MLQAQSAAEMTVQPKAIKQEKPLYPFAMRQAGITGVVQVNFIVNSRGEVSAAQVERSSHPGFREAALDAVHRWRFEPGEVKGRKVNTHMQVPITFDINGASANAGWSVKRPKKFPEDWPDYLSWDVAPKLKVYNPPVYPRESLLAGREGTVIVKFVVGPTGSVLSATVDDAEADNELASAGIAAVQSNEFEPPRKRDGSPCGALLNMKFRFRKSGDESEAPVTAEMKRIGALLSAGSATALLNLNELDHVPRAVAQRAPTIPPALIESAEPAEALVEFVINRDGETILPRVLETTDEAFGYAAVQAVADWGFTIPMHNGKPVDVLARLPVQFTPDAETNAKP